VYGIGNSWDLLIDYRRDQAARLHKKAGQTACSHSLTCLGIVDSSCRSQQHMAIAMRVLSHPTVTLQRRAQKRDPQLYIRSQPEKGGSR
jgi:hypothetical protein